MIKVAFFGDSICLGQGVSIHNGWVVRLSNFIEKKLNNSSPSLIFNSSYNGRTSREALLQMSFEILDHKPDIVLIQFGMNDCNYWKTHNGIPRVSIKSFKENIAEMIDRSFNSGVKYVIVNTNHPTPKRSKFEYANVSYEESNSLYNEALREISNSNNNFLINDMNKKIQKFLNDNNKIVEDIVLVDGIHLNLLGHELYFNFTSKILRGLIKKLSDEL